MENNIDYSVAKTYWSRKRRIHINLGWFIFVIIFCILGFLGFTLFKYFTNMRVDNWYEIIPQLFFISLIVYVLRLSIRLFLLQMNIWADAAGKLAAIGTYELSHKNLTDQEKLHILKIIHEPQSKMDLSTLENKFEILK